MAGLIPEPAGARLGQDKNPMLLQIKDLYVQFSVYGGKLRVLDGVNFRMSAGERVGLVGETGCGKTTMMKSILRVLPRPPAQIPHGEIFFKGRDVLKMNSEQVRRVRGRGASMIFQDPTAALNPVFTIGQQLEAVIRHASGPERVSVGQMHQRALASLEEVALADPDRLLRSYPVQLSGGMRQRVTSRAVRWM
jgi:peptide/nickel transport system ATP-binding protein